ncbi:hypothetical protein ACF1GW_38805 [Streptomyces achromogenes]|uniref:hypothetical protein n=1 Tax=Streptomyces achromogenes TaxID=67255 RepID=UPI0036F9A425
MTFEQFLIDIRFWEQILGDGKREVYCQSAIVEAVQTAVGDAGVAHFVTVRTTPACPDGYVLIVDPSAFDAGGLA